MTKDQAVIHVLMKENDELKLEIGRLRNNAVIIPDGATNGDVIKAMFPNVEASVFVKEVGVKGLDTYSTFTKKWWNAPYNPPKQNLAPADKSGLGYADQPTLQSAT
jgi:hypothetical protein